MGKTVRRIVLIVATMAGVGAGTARAQSADSTQGLKFMVSPGLGFGTGGAHAYGRGDSKPGEYLIGRVGLIRKGRPFLVVDGEFQLYAAPYPKNPDAPLSGGRDTTTAPTFKGPSVLAGVALYPVADFYLMPQVGMQFRTWSGLAEPTISESDFAAGLIAGYHLQFGSTFSMQPEFVLRYAAMSGPGSPSFRSAGFRLMATWRL